MENKDRRIDLTRLSDTYEVRRVSEQEAEAVYQLCIGNPLYYEFCPPQVTRESIREDMVVLPPNVDSENKYYIGFWQEDKLIAVMDLIAGYPEPSIAFIGFFMTEKSVQKNGVGSAIIEKLCSCLGSAGFQTARLAWVKGNPQSEHFWLKNHFEVLKETKGINLEAETIILAQRML